MEKLHVSRPVYPLLSVLSSAVIFFIGLLVSKEVTIVYFLLALTSVYILFGYAKVLFKTIPIFLIIGTIIGTGSIITSGSYMIGIQTGGRILLLAYSSVIMVALPPVNLTRNLNQLRFPRILTLGMLVTIRFVPILISETIQINEAMKTRGINVRWYNLSCVYRAFLVPFMIRIISMSDIMAVSMETRGFVLKDKSNTVYKKITFTPRDALFAIILITITIGVILIWIG